MDDVDLISTLTQIDLKSIISFIIVVETKTLMAASEVLDCSQASVSIYLKRLRSIVDEPLFTREGRYLQPTEAAILLSARFKSCLIELYEMLPKSRPEDACQEKVF
jgi:DNA-binding transcriptional LysR family regulator